MDLESISLDGYYFQDQNLSSHNSYDSSFSNSPPMINNDQFVNIGNQTTPFVDNQRVVSPVFIVNNVQNVHHVHQQNNVHNVQNLQNVQQVQQNNLQQIQQNLPQNLLYNNNLQAGGNVVQQQYAQKPSGLNRSLLLHLTTAKDFAGEMDFQYEVNCYNTTATKAYSKKLAKVYVNMGQTLLINFSWNQICLTNDLWIRTALFYVDEQHRRMSVQRCYAHVNADSLDNHNVPEEQKLHVIRSTNPYTRYERSDDDFLSMKTLVSTSQLGETGKAVLDYLFFCKNSCATGIQRRHTKMVFTLETADGYILGRQSLGIQICSCPKRDKDRDERALEKKNSIQPVVVTSKPEKPKKKIMEPKPVMLPQLPLLQQELPNLPLTPPRDISSSNEDELASSASDEDTTVYPLKLHIVGEENCRAVMRYAWQIMTAKAVETNNFDTYARCLKDIEDNMKNGIS